MNIPSRLVIKLDIEYHQVSGDQYNMKLIILFYNTLVGKCAFAIIQFLYATRSATIKTNDLDVLKFDTCGDADDGLAKKRSLGLGHKGQLNKYKMNASFKALFQALF